MDHGVFLSARPFKALQGAAFSFGRAKFIPARFLASQKKGGRKPFGSAGFGWRHFKCAIFNFRIIVRMCYFISGHFK
jgi:hypothetical protein